MSNPGQMAAESVLWSPCRAVTKKLEIQWNLCMTPWKAFYTENPNIASQHSYNMSPQFKGKENEAQKDLKVLAKVIAVKVNQG